MKKTNIGGQAVLEGVMMRGETHSAMAVRREDGSIVTKEWDNKTRSNKIFKLPIIRGVVNFVDMMVLGISIISDAAKLYDPVAAEKDMEPGKFEKFVAKKTGKNPMDIMMVFAVVLGLALAVGLFFILPTFITGLIRGSIADPFSVNLIDGGIRLAIFVAYLLAVRNMKEIKRTFSYHGAEHATINCYESEEPLTVENVMKSSTYHSRCGTAFLLIVMVLAILIYSLFGWSDNILLRFGTRILALPLIAGVAYELLKLLAKYENWLVKILRYPGMLLQRLTTIKPDENMCECAILAFEMAAQEKSPDYINELTVEFDRSVKTAPNDEKVNVESDGSAKPNDTNEGTPKDNAISEIVDEIAVDL